MMFDAADTMPIILSLPVWAPGSYEVSNFARWVSDFRATSRGAQLEWEKVDPSTWRVHLVTAGPVTILFNYRADTLDMAMAWTGPDFLFFNGANVFLYPKGRSLDFPASVTVRTEPGWRVVTSMRPQLGQNVYGESNYHDLSDMPFFVGRFDVDSAQIAGKWQRLASYPAGTLRDTARSRIWQAIAKLVPAEAAVFKDMPWPDYTTMMVFSDSFGGGSALEHARGNLGIYTPQLIGSPLLDEVIAHEIFHSWNVKRLRPSDLWPYRYDDAQPTRWLWVSEGITEYYGELMMSRGHVTDEEYLWKSLTRKMHEVSAAPPVALEDASLSTWIRPEDGTGDLYYSKGALAGFLLDIMIRDASDNRRSLDTVMYDLYETTYQLGRGFTANDWWGAVSRAAGGRSFAEFIAKYVDGRNPYPYAQVLPLAGLRLQVDTQHIVRIGMQAQVDSSGLRIIALIPGGMAERAGLHVGDYVVRMGDVSVASGDFGPTFLERYGRKPEGTLFPIMVRRTGQTVSLNGTVHYVTETNTRIVPDPVASRKAIRIRNSIAGDSAIGR